MKTLILYSSRCGQAQKIAEHIAAQLGGQPCEQLPSEPSSCESSSYEKQQAVDLVDLHSVETLDLSAYQRVLIGASIRYGHFHPSLNRFVKRHYQALNAMPGAFFSVNLVARKPEKRTPQTNIYTRKFLQRSPWRPDLCAVFAGAVRYPRYLWYQRLMVLLIMTITGGETDTSKEVEYTDWQQVTAFANELAGLSTAKKAAEKAKK